MLRHSIVITSLLILFFEVALVVLYREDMIRISLHYAWFLPLLFFKSFIKKFLLLNFYGLCKVLGGVLWHVLKLLLLKLLKTFGVRYGTYFTSKRWVRVSHKINTVVQSLRIKRKKLQQFMESFSRGEYMLITCAFFPLFMILFLFGVAFKLTREAMVKKGSEFGVSKVAFKAARNSQGLVACLQRLDTWILEKIEKLAT